MKKTLIALAVAVPAALAVGYFVLQGKTFEVRIRNDQIQEQLDKKFPIQKTHLLIFELTYKDPTVVLQEGTDRVTVKLNVELKIKGIETLFSGTVEATTGIDFDQETGNILLRDCEISRLQIEGIPAKYTDRVSTLASKVAKEILDRVPVYTLKAKDAKTAAAKLVLKDVVIDQGELVVTLGF